MTSPSEQAGLVAGTLRAKPGILCAVLKELRGELLAGAWEGMPDHESRADPWTGQPLCSVWRDQKLPQKRWRWAVRVRGGSNGICSTKARAKAEATIDLKGRGYTLANWKEDDD